MITEILSYLLLFYNQKTFNDFIIHFFNLLIFLDSYLRLIII